LKATARVTSPTIVAVITKGFQVALSVIFGMVQSAYRSIYFHRCSLVKKSHAVDLHGKVAIIASEARDSYCAEG
jgi:hypothetical protein